MLAAVEPDFVDVATTVETHRPLVELALAHGALTICQKPFAQTWADGLAMVEAAERAGRPLIVHENFRWQRPLRLLRAEIDAGAIGTPVLRAHLVPPRLRRLRQPALSRRGRGLRR